MYVRRDEGVVVVRGTKARGPELNKGQGAVVVQRPEGYSCTKDWRDSSGDRLADVR